ncbi:MAG: RsmE family RNA methyltransferase [Nitriliruptorales bacterium]|nr:RsmE family RNA methyltransferase [Nitriliruptorales bacterium]
MTPHFFVAPEQVGSGVALLGPDDSRHLVTVLRGRPGDRVTVADGTGTLWNAVYQGHQGGLVEIALLESTFLRQRHPAFTVVHALPRQRKLDDVIQRLTELGVSRVVPVHSERSQVELDQHKAAKAVARWRAVALAAAKQSRRARLPVIEEVGEWPDAFADGCRGIVLWEESPVALRTALDDMPAVDELVLGIGPEGGLTRGEVAATRLPHASLGPTVLRTETAAIVAVSALAYHYGLMEPI